MHWLSVTCLGMSREFAADIRSKNNQMRRASECFSGWFVSGRKHTSFKDDESLSLVLWAMFSDCSRIVRSLSPLCIFFGRKLVSSWQYKPFKTWKLQIEAVTYWSRLQAGDCEVHWIWVVWSAYSEPKSSFSTISTMHNCESIYYPVQSNLFSRQIILPLKIFPTIWVRKLLHYWFFIELSRLMVFVYSILLLSQTICNICWEKDKN